MSYSIHSRGDSLVSVVSGVLHDALHAILSTNYWQKLQMTALPLLASTLWHCSHTVIKVTDDEQVLWIQMWLSQQTKALERVRRLHVFPSTTAGRNRRGRMHRVIDEEEAEGDKEDGGRFAPPKLDFQPDRGVVTWTWSGLWPISVSRATPGTTSYYNPYSGEARGDNGYFFTVWFSPFARSIARDVMHQGRQLYLAKKAKKTEIWMHHHEHGGFKIVTRPSRPLSSVVVEGNTKENIREDAIQFLDSEKWYISKGIPYRRGYLLHGPPGCGKTSLITALAGDLRMPIVVVPLNDQHMDDRGLMQILGDAPKNSIVLIEDIDCALPKDVSQRAVADMRNRYGGTPVTLSGLLNAIDGVGAQEGRLLFMTTNHIDRLDEALIRPGRVDVKYHLGKASKEGAGELFDQFFASSSAPQEAITKGRRGFVQGVENGVHSFASLQGIFMSAKDDPGKVATAMNELVACSSSSEDPAKKTSAYDKVMAIEKNRKDALEKEKRAEDAQREAGKTVVKRLTGNPLHTMHNTELQQINYCGCFPTYGAPEKLATSGVLYYEIEVIKAYRNCQFGFALKDGIPITELDTGAGVGDNASSWAVDGIRGRLWHGGADTEWKGTWLEGTVIGLAVNVSNGMIAASKDGSWTEPGFGVVFNDKAIQKGVFPAFSASNHTIRYRFQGEEGIQYGPPPVSVWESENTKEEDASATGNHSQPESLPTALNL